MKKLPKIPLATVTDAPPRNERWVHEVKWDGYRILMSTLEGEKPKFFTRSQKDWTHKFSVLSGELKGQIPEDTIIDGEMVAIDAKVGSSFSTLQEALKKNEQDSIAFYAFDLPVCQGEDLTEMPLVLRKELLRELISSINNSHLLFSDYFDEDGEVMLENACNLHLEGVVSKMVDSPYEGGRGEIWLKSRCLNAGDFLIVGYTAPKGARSCFGSLLLASKDEGGELVYVGNVGTGFDENTLRSLKKEMDQLIVDQSPFKEKVSLASQVQWIKPQLIAQVNYSEWTHGKRLRHPVFVALRDDKPTEEVELRGEKTHSPVATKKTSDRMLFPEINLRKDELIELMEEVAPLMLEEVNDHPLTLVRCPQGEGKECFFQKHPSSEDPYPVLITTIDDKDFMYIENWEGLRELLRQNTLEVHMWNVMIQDLDCPTEFVIDLDPGHQVEWSTFVDATLGVKHALDQMDLTSFVKYTGGKGFHIHLPLAPDYTVEEVYEFSKKLCSGFEAADPGLFTVNPRKSGRSNKIFLDYLRNGPGASYIAPYSIRAKPKAPIALPLDWSEVKAFSIEDAATIVDVRHILKRANPWKRKKQVKNKLP